MDYVGGFYDSCGNAMMEIRGLLFNHRPSCKVGMTWLMLLVYARLGKPTSVLTAYSKFFYCKTVWSYNRGMLLASQTLIGSSRPQDANAALRE